MLFLAHCLRYRIVATRMPWVATAQAFERKPRTPDRAMLFDRFDRVLRTTRGIAAMAAEERTDEIAVDPDGYGQEFSHFFIMLSQCFSSAVRISAGSDERISRRTMITMSRGGKRLRLRRKLSRNNRFNALRSTALDTCLRAIAKPRRGLCPSCSPTRIVIRGSPKRVFFLNTFLKSIARDSLSRRGNPSLPGAFTITA